MTSAAQTALSLALPTVLAAPPPVAPRVPAAGTPTERPPRPTDDLGPVASLVPVVLVATALVLVLAVLVPGGIALLSQTQPAPSGWGW